MCREMTVFAVLLFVDGTVCYVCGEGMAKLISWRRDLHGILCQHVAVSPRTNCKCQSLVDCEPTLHGLARTSDATDLGVVTDNLV